MICQTHLKYKWNFTFVFKTQIMLNEQALTFGTEIRPLFGHVVVLAGGAGVGKGAVVDNLIDFPKAKYLNPDSLKKYVSYADDISLKSSKTLVAMARVKSSKKFRQHLIDHMEDRKSVV